jgi:hypothetical protein
MSLCAAELVLGYVAGLLTLPVIGILYLLISDDTPTPSPTKGPNNVN